MSVVTTSPNWVYDCVECLSCWCTPDYTQSKLFNLHATLFIQTLFPHLFSTFRPSHFAFCPSGFISNQWTPVAKQVQDNWIKNTFYSRGRERERGSEREREREGENIHGESVYKPRKIFEVRKSELFQLGNKKNKNKWRWLYTKLQDCTRLRC